MSKEIERKFLVKNLDWKSQAKGTLYRQGYLNSEKERTVRVRTIDEKSFITVKGITTGVTRMEFEYEIPFADATQMLDKLVEKPIIEKWNDRIAYFFVDIASPLKTMLETQYHWSSDAFGFYGGQEFFFNVFLGFLIISGIIFPAPSHCLVRP